MKIYVQSPFDEIQALHIENSRLNLLLDEVKQENQQLRKVLDQLINDVLCMCSEGPDVMRSGDIYKTLIEAAKNARQYYQEDKRE
jgi:predicted nuclease with TOPRIM domain